MSAIVTYLRAENDPEVIAKGPSPLSAAERLGKGLGWFSLVLGAAELFGGRRIAETLGLEGKSGLVRLFGMREVASGMLILSADRQTGLWSRVGGDVLDILLLGTALDAPTTRQRSNAKLALATVIGVTVLDLMAASAVAAERRRTGEPRDFRQRSGFPRGVNAARGGAKDFTVPRNMRADIEVVR